MAIGTTGSVDPVTGERTESQFEYTPVDPQDDMMRQLANQAQQAFYPSPPQPRGPTPYWENPETYYGQQPQIDPIAQAKAATMAAQKFIAFRGYQNDLKEGMSAQDAMARWAPMLFQDTSVAPAIKSLQQPKPYTFNPQTSTYENAGGLRPVPVPRAPEAPRFIPSNPQTGEPAHWQTSGGRVQNLPSQSAPKLDQITMADYNDARKEFNTALKEYTKEDNDEEIKLDARKRMDAAKIRMNNISNRGQAGEQAAPAAPAQQQPSAPTAPIAMPKAKGDLITGQKYLTSKGEATWDGSKFVK